MRAKGFLFLGVLLFLLGGCDNPETTQDEGSQSSTVGGALSVPVSYVVVDNDPEAKKAKKAHYDYVPGEVMTHFLSSGKSTIDKGSIDPTGIAALAEDGPVGVFEPIYGEFGELIELRGVLVHIPAKKENKTPQASAANFLEQIQPAFRLSPDSTLVFTDILDVTEGWRVTWMQYHQGLPVEEARLDLWLDLDLGLTRIRSSLIPWMGTKMATPPAASAVQIDEALHWSLGDFDPKSLQAHLSYRRISRTQPEMALTWTVSAVESAEGSLPQELWIDALTGEVLFEKDAVLHGMVRRIYDHGTPNPPVPPVCDVPGTLVYDDTPGSECCGVPCASWPCVNFPPEGTQTVDALGAWYNFFDTEYDHQSYDGDDAPLEVVINHITQNFCGGFIWDPSTTPACGRMVLHNTVLGDSEVVDHEAVHGFMQVHALMGPTTIPQNLSLGEHIADAMTSVKSVETGTSIWTWPQNGSTICGSRRLDDPSLSTYKNPTGSNQLAMVQPKEWSYYAADPAMLGWEAHFNNGIGNYAAYLLSEGGTFNNITVTGQGRESLGQMLYYLVRDEISRVTNYDGYTIESENAARAWDIRAGLTGLPTMIATKAATAAVGLWRPKGVVPSLATECAPAGVVIQNATGGSDMLLFTKGTGFKADDPPDFLHFTRYSGSSWGPDTIVSDLQFIDNPSITPTSATTAELFVTKADNGIVQRLVIDGTTSFPVTQFWSLGYVTDHGPSSAKLGNDTFVFFRNPADSKTLYSLKLGGSGAQQVISPTWGHIVPQYQTFALEMAGRVWIFYTPQWSDEIWYTSTSTPSVNDSWEVPQKFDTPFFDDIDVTTNSMVTVGMWSNNAYLTYLTTDPNAPTRGISQVRFLPRSSGLISNVTRSVIQNDFATGNPPSADFVGPSLSYMANQNFFFVNDQGNMVWKQRRGK